MTKFWEAGKVKTRLGSSLGMDQAASVHRLFVSYLCDSLSTAGGRRVISFSPDSRLDDLRTALESWHLDSDWDIMPQGDGDLGERMQRWFESSLPTEDSRSILIGTDCPLLSRRVIVEASELLLTHDAVLGPAVDGGYYLIGLRGSWNARGHDLQHLFTEINWSTDEVLDTTIRRLREAELSFAELSISEDIDTISELRNLFVSADVPSRLRQELETILGLEKGETL
ncbi:MAG: TIGR04282 family arsenosugar biosynthesis glycosyltransferase [Rubripirellula sp.]